MPLLEVRAVAKRFAAPRASGRGRAWVQALDGVSFALGRGEVLALVGESGSGKSTLAQLLVGLERPSAGQVCFAGDDIGRLSRPALKAARRRIQMVFQDPYESLNPTMSVAETVAEPLAVHCLATDPPERDRRVRAALEDVGLAPAESYLSRRPHERGPPSSGGEAWRAA